MKIKKGIILVCLFSLISCKNDKTEKIEYDKDGNIASKSYISNDNFLDSVIYYKKNMINKCIFHKNKEKSFYFKSFTLQGNLIAEGNTIDNIKNGKWKFYGSNAKDIGVIEFKNICGEEYSNQGWDYDKNNNLRMNASNFYTYKLKDSISKNGKLKVLKISYIPLNKKGAICTINFSKDIDSTFCNVDKVKKNAFYSSNNTFIVPMMFDQKGKKNFRGYIEEHLFEEINNSNLSNHYSKKIYIDIPFEVE